MSSHKHFCIGKCGDSYRCSYPVIRDDCGAHCEREEAPGYEEYECMDCYEARRKAEEEADRVAEQDA